VSWTTLVTLLAVLNLICALVGYTFLAYALARLRWRGRGVPLVLFAIIISAQVWWIPQLIVSLILHQDTWHHDLHFADGMVTAFGIVLFWLLLRNISPAPFDAARLDGLSSLGICWHVVVPLVRSALVFLGIFVLLATWTDFVGIFVAPERHGFPRTLPTSSWDVIGPLLAVAAGWSTLGALPLVVIFFLARKLFPPSDSFEQP